MISEVIIKCPYLILLLDYYSLLSVILLLQALLDDAHHLGVFEEPLLLQIKLSPQFNDLILFNDGLVIEDLSEFLLICLQPLSVFVHLGGLSPHLFDLVVKFLVLRLQQRDFLLQVFHLSLQSQWFFSLV
jgi:hypothetical protein